MRDTLTSWDAPYASLTTCRALSLNEQERVEASLLLRLPGSAISCRQQKEKSVALSVDIHAQYFVAFACDELKKSEKAKLMKIYGRHSCTGEEEAGDENQTWEIIKEIIISRGE